LGEHGRERLVDAFGVQVSSIVQMVPANHTPTNPKAKRESRQQYLEQRLNRDRGWPPDILDVRSVAVGANSGGSAT
jgi:hypothetical protein